MEIEKNENVPSIVELKKNLQEALVLVDDIVLKNYISNLDKLEIQDFDLSEEKRREEISQIRMIKIKRINYQKNENSLYKYGSILSAIFNLEASFLMLIKGNINGVDIYLGTKNKESSSSDILTKTVEGQFLGTSLERLYVEDIEKVLDFSNGDKSELCSVVTGIANNKNKDFIDNEKYIQGLEKLIISLQGKEYTAAILANPVSSTELNEIRIAYENIYTQLSSFSTMAINQGETKGENISKSTTEGENYSKTITTSTSISKATPKAKVANILGTTITVLGAITKNMFFYTGAAALGSAINTVFGETEAKSNGTSETNGKSKSTSDTFGTSIGESKNLQLTVQNKTIQNILKRIDKQLERIEEFESIGMWETAAYFFSEDLSTTKIAASTYKSLVNGENTGIEKSAINTWYANEKEKNKIIGKYLSILEHPLFIKDNINGNKILLTPTSVVSSNELAIAMSLPRKSVPGFPVVKCVDFGKEIINYSKDSRESLKITLGNIFNMGKESNLKVELDKQSLAMHTFVTGSTGSGKSNTIYTLLKELNEKRVKFLVIEPAKGEYKNIFGQRKDVNIFGTNPNYTKILRINPFNFPEKIHVLEHIDRLIDIFNVCWPMYAAMPAILKEAIENTYEKAGWNLETSRNKYDTPIFPTFIDLLSSLREVINSSDYSKEIKDNYTGSLITRVKSLTNGLNRNIFSANEIENKILFDENTIIDLSRVGSNETKSFIMGILTMRLQEHRMSNIVNMNEKLKHVTVLEEAHNLLKRTSTEQGSESSNLLGKSVEMIANAIAEMRTYGEGFIIADQAPGLLDMSIIRNTNTKIVMSLPDFSDRELVGKSMGLNEEQIEEIAKLPTGVGVVYQNKWLESVLGKIKKFEIETKEYLEPENNINLSGTDIKRQVLETLVSNLENQEINKDIENLKNIILESNLDVTFKIDILKVFVNKGNNKENITNLICKSIDNLDEIIDKVKKSKTLEEFNNTILKELNLNFEKEKELKILENIVLYYSKIEDNLKFYNNWVSSMEERVI